MSKKQPYWKNSRIHLLLGLMTLALIIIPAMNKTPDEETSIKATDAAVKFLYLVDSGKYVQSWEASSDHLQKTLPQEKWRAQLAEIRETVGTIVERVKDEVTYLEGDGDMPAGEYVVIRFNSKFSDKEYVLESVTLHLGAGKEWRVAGYFLK